MSDQERLADPRAGLSADDERTRVAAVRACARARDAAALDQLRKMAGEDASVEVRYQARVALSVIREALAGSGARPRPDMPTDPSAGDVRRMLSSGEPGERVWALREAVLHEEAPELVPAVLARIDREHDADVRAQLVTTLAEMGGAAMRDHVARFLQDADARVRANAVEAAETLGDPKLEPMVVKALQDSDHRVKLNAVTALDRAGKLSLVKCCAYMMRDKHYWVRDAAAYSLAAARSPAAVPFLARALLDPHEPVRTKARDGLQALVEAGVDAARHALAHPGPAAMDTVDTTAVTATPDEGAIPQLVERLRTETEVRSTARLLTVLASLGNPVIVPIVVEYLNHPSLEVSRLAEVALQRLGAEHLLPKPKNAGPVTAVSGAFRNAAVPRSSGAVTSPVAGVTRPVGAGSGSVPRPAAPSAPPSAGAPAPEVPRPAPPPVPHQPRDPEPARVAPAPAPAPPAPVVPTFHPGPTITRPAAPPGMLVPVLLLFALIAVVAVLLR